MKIRVSTKLVLFAILLLAISLRLYNMQWDQGFHLHPDERAIIMVVDHLSLPSSISEFFSPASPWNPHFFAYGSFPFYLLFFAGNFMSIFNPHFADYGLLNLVGRFISAFSDLITIVILFRLGRKLFSTHVGYIAAFFYAISVLPIQLSHFYAVDTILTCLTLSVLYQLILFYEQPTIKRSLLIGLLFGLALATKVSAIVLIVAIGATLIADFMMLFFKNPNRPKHWLPHLPAFLTHLIRYACLIGITTIATFVFFEPYAVIDFHNFWIQTIQQSMMTKDAFVFPYTLQYVGKLPYLYELKNIFFFGLGPLLAIFAFLGTAYFTFLTLTKEESGRFAKETLLLIFFVFYFFVVGKFAIGFMRYMLPVYPLLALFAAVLIQRLLMYFELRERMLTIVSCYTMLVLTLWTFSFMHIYANNNTRVDASTWIMNNIPAGKAVAVEHWDDPLPLAGAENYQMITLPLYDPDTPSKWQSIKQQLQNTDYIIIASNRLYTPLQKMTNCQTLPVGRCYPQTANYYQKLFSGQLGFQKVAEFTNYPTLPFFNIPINDQGADESFTVYDHPKIMIFQKTAPLPAWDQPK